MEVIPAILAKTEDEFRTKIEAVRPLGQRVQIDVIDGRFVENATWSPISEVVTLLRGLPFEVHLMVSDPEHAAPLWVAAGAESAYVHAEATHRELLINRAMGRDDGHIGIAINPETPVNRIVPDLPRLKRVLVMGVSPGWSGQAFQEIAVEKVRAIRDLEPTVTITVDGGITPENAPRLAEAGADILVAGSALTDHWNPLEAYEEFQRALR
ncbi:hypothetical protein AMJ57_03370 [Parcubacteria bacterium SG8_24]|nr:MAG: hypothetical protein AMJ57_03370 [Parcubacteria bacterium SG8_24]